MKQKDKILLVDDERIALRLTQKLLSKHGYVCDTAQSSTEALKMLNKGKYMLAIIDISMPTINGFDLIQLMQSLDYDVPVIFLSNSDNEWTIQESYNIGARRFVSKEREFNSLPQIIKDVLAEVS